MVEAIAITLFALYLLGRFWEEGALWFTVKSLTIAAFVVVGGFFAIMHQLDARDNDLVRKIEAEASAFRPGMFDDLIPTPAAARTVIAARSDVAVDPYAIHRPAYVDFSDLRPALLR